MYSWYCSCQLALPGNPSTLNTSTLVQKYSLEFNFLELFAFLQNIFHYNIFSTNHTPPPPLSHHDHFLLLFVLRLVSHPNLLSLRKKCPSTHVVAWDSDDSYIDLICLIQFDVVCDLAALRATSSLISEIGRLLGTLSCGFLADKAEQSGRFDSRLRLNFSRSSHTSDKKNDTPVATQTPGAIWSALGLVSGCQYIVRYKV